MSGIKGKDAVVEFPTRDVDKWVCEEVSIESSGEPFLFSLMPLPMWPVRSKGKLEVSDANSPCCGCCCGEKGFVWGAVGGDMNGDSYSFADGSGATLVGWKIASPSDANACCLLVDISLISVWKEWLFSDCVDSRDSMLGWYVDGVIVAVFWLNEASNKRCWRTKNGMSSTPTAKKCRV